MRVRVYFLIFFFFTVIPFRFFLFLHSPISPNSKCVCVVLRRPRLTSVCTTDDVGAAVATQPRAVSARVVRARVGGGAIASSSTRRRPFIDFSVFACRLVVVVDKESEFFL